MKSLLILRGIIAIALIACAATMGAETRYVFQKAIGPDGTIYKQSAWFSKVLKINFNNNGFYMNQPGGLPTLRWTLWRNDNGRLVYAQIGRDWITGRESVINPYEGNGYIYVFNSDKSVLNVLYKGNDDDYTTAVYKPQSDADQSIGKFYE